MHTYDLTYVCDHPRQKPMTTADFRIALDHQIIHPTGSTTAVIRVFDAVTHQLLQTFPTQTFHVGDIVVLHIIDHHKNHLTYEVTPVLDERTLQDNGYVRFYPAQPPRAWSDLPPMTIIPPILTDKPESSD